MSKVVLFQTIQFSISKQLSSIWPIDRTLLGTTTPGQNWHGGDGNEVMLHIPQSSSTTGTSPSDCLVSYLGHSLGVVLPLYRGSVDWAICMIDKSLLKRIPFTDPIILFPNQILIDKCDYANGTTRTVQTMNTLQYKIF